MIYGTQQTEFGVKVALPGALTVICSFVPLIERRSLRPFALSPPLAALVLIAVSVPAATSLLANDERLLEIERGISRTGGPVQ